MPWFNEELGIEVVLRDPYNHTKSFLKERGEWCEDNRSAIKNKKRKSVEKVVETSAPSVFPLKYKTKTRAESGAKTNAPQ